MNYFAATMHVGENEILEFDFSRNLEYKWQPGEEYQIDQVVRPLSPNGYEYQVVDAGQSGSEEPEWADTPGQRLNDGSVIWKTLDFADAAIDAIDTAPVTVVGGGTVGSVLVHPTDVITSYTAVAIGTDVVTCKATTVLGRIIHGIFRITVIA